MKVLNVGHNKIPKIKHPIIDDSVEIYIRFRTHRYMAEILPIWRKTLYNQSINQ